MCYIRIHINVHNAYLQLGYLCILLPTVSELCAGVLTICFSCNSGKASEGCVADRDIVIQCHALLASFPGHSYILSCRWGENAGDFPRKIH